MTKSLGRRDNTDCWRCKAIGLLFDICDEQNQTVVCIIERIIHGMRAGCKTKQNALIKTIRIAERVNGKILLVPNSRFGPNEKLTV